MHALKPVASKYHPAIVTIHWLVALMIIVSLVRGFTVVAPMANSDPHKIEVLRRHATVGMVVLVLMSMRFVLRLRLANSLAANPVAALAHYGFYALVFALAGTGLATAFASGIFPILYHGSKTALPDSFQVFPARIAHGIIAWTLVSFISLHLLAVLYHQFLKKEPVLHRMWFGKRTIAKVKIEGDKN